MPLLHWSPNLSVGIDFIDADHREIIALVNALEECVRSAQHDAIATALNRLIERVREHFAQEEASMRENDYPDAALHTNLHAALIEEVEELRARFDAGELSVGPETTAFLKDWLLSHILESDKHLGGFLEGRWSR